MENKQNLFNAWYELARTMTPETLGALGKTLRNSVQDSEDLIHATIAMMDAAAYAMVKDLEVGPEFMYLLSVLAYRHINNLGDGYSAILNYDDMLDPSKRSSFEKTMPEHVFTDLQEKAHALLASGEKLHPAQQKHLENIVKGRVPFGYTIVEEDMVTDPRNYELRKAEEEHVCEDENCECQHEHEEELPEVEQEIEIPDEILNQFISAEDEQMELNEEMIEEDNELIEPEFVEDDYDEEVMSEQPFDEFDNEPTDEMEYEVDDVEDKVDEPEPIVEEPVKRKVGRRSQPLRPEPVIEEEPEPTEEYEEDSGMSLAEALSKLQNTRYMLDRE